MGEIMWKDLSSHWKEAFRLAWEAYKNDTIPIGAIIVNANGNIIAEGRNQIFDENSSNPLAGTYMAHAEMTAMMQLKVNEHPDIKTYSLYTTMEPCPMCFGTMLMMHICDLKYAARDGFAGATELKDTIGYIKKKTMNIERGCEEVEAFQIVLQSSFEYKRNHNRIEEILDTWRVYCDKGVSLGKVLYTENYFGDAIRLDKKIEDIFDCVLERYKAASMMPQGINPNVF